MNKARVYLLLIVFNINIYIFAKYEKDCDKCLSQIYQACPEIKNSMCDLSGIGGQFSSEARILLGILAKRLGELEKCPNLQCLENSLNIFEKCVVREKLKNLDLSGFNSINQDQLLALILKDNLDQERMRDLAIRRKCFYEFKRKLDKTNLICRACGKTVEEYNIIKR